MIVAGLGCRRGCMAADVVAAVRLAERSAGLAATALAAPRFKAQEAGVQAAAAALGLPLLLVEGAAMQAAQPHCLTRSDVAMAVTGLASVAEGAALAASGGPLLLPRVSVGGATCALAGPLLPLPPGLGREADQGRGEGVGERSPAHCTAPVQRRTLSPAPQPRPPHPNPLPEGEA